MIPTALSSAAPQARRRPAAMLLVAALALMGWGCGAAAAPEAAYVPGAAYGADAVSEQAPAEPGMPAPPPVATPAADALPAELAAPVPAPGAAASPEDVAAAEAPAPGPAEGATGSASIAKRPAPSGASRAKEGDPAATKLEATSVAQMLIYTAQMRLRVPSKGVSSTIDRVVELAVGMGGYLAQQDDTNVQVRVPSVRFREALKAIESLGEVVQRAVQAQDVTEEYHDLSVRLKSLRATRDRLEQFLGRAKDIQEVLAVEKELDRINGEIDRIEGRMRFLASRAAFSTITVALEPKPETAVVVGDHTPPPPPPPRTLPLPIEWLNRVGLDRLLQLD